MSTATLIRANTLASSSQGENVKALQRTLNQQFAPYIKLSEDGFFGNKTTSAVKYVQCLAGLSIDGIVGARTADFLARGAQSLPVLNIGSTGDHVKAIQKVLLNQRLMSGSIDGIYGQVTQQAVKAFQRRRSSLNADGVVGAQTWRRMLHHRKNDADCLALLNTVPTEAFIGLWSSEGNVDADSTMEVEIFLRDGKLVGVLRANKFSGADSGAMSLVSTEDFKGTASITIDLFNDSRRLVTGKAVLLLQGHTLLSWQLVEAAGLAQVTLPEIAGLSRTNERNVLNVM